MQEELMEDLDEKACGLEDKHIQRMCDYLRGKEWTDGEILGFLDYITKE